MDGSMDPEIRKLRRRMVFGAIFVPAILLLWLGAALLMRPGSWMMWSFLVGWLALICDLSRKSPRVIRSEGASPHWGYLNGTSWIFTVFVIVTAQLTGRSKRVRALLNDLTTNGLDLPLVGGLGLLLLGWIVLRLRRAREVTDEELLQYLERKAADDLEKPRRSQEPVEY